MVTRCCVRNLGHLSPQVGVTNQVQLEPMHTIEPPIAAPPPEVRSRREQDSRKGGAIPNISW